MVDEASQWEHRMAAVNGINIHYVIEGQGEPVVFIHGWPEFWYGWRRQIPVMSGRYQVIVPDLRGFGYSDKPLHGYDTKSAASDNKYITVPVISSGFCSLFIGRPSTY